MQNLGRAGGAHDRDLRGRPRVVRVAPQMLRGHNIIGASISFSRDDRELRHRRFRISKEQFSTMPDDAAVLLRHAG